MPVLPSEPRAASSGGARSAGRRLRFRPLRAGRWDDLEELFGRHGAYGGCWCMYWRITRAQFARNGNRGNRDAFRTVVDSGEVPGILAYLGQRPVGWCSVAPRSQFASLNRSPVLKPVDDTPVWSIVCFFLSPEHRREGRLMELVQGAVDYARRNGALAVEAYPPAPRGRELAPVSAYMGLPSVFERAGFDVCARPSPGRMVMRRTLIGRDG